MACTRRSLRAGFSHLSRRSHPSFTHFLHDDRDNGEQSRRPFPTADPSLLVPPAFLRPVPSLGRNLRLGLSYFSGLDHFPQRFYSSGAGERSNEMELVSDISEVLKDATIDTAVDAASIAPAPFPGEVAAAAADSFLPVAGLQHLIDGVHTFCGLNWWASIALTTVLIRGATIPLLLNTMRATVKLNMMRPDLEKLREDMQNSMDPDSLQKGQKRMKALFAQHGVTPFTPVKGLFIQGPIFISFFFAIMNMVEKVPSFKGGGAFWFTDLTTPDPSYTLPVLTSLTFLTTVELNMQEGMEGNPMVKTMKNFSRVIGLLTIPFTAHFPKAIFCYWITSNIFSLMYGLVIRRPPVRKFLNLPDIVPQTTNTAPQPIFSVFNGSKSITPTSGALNSKEPEQCKPLKWRVSSSSVLRHRIRNLERLLKARSKQKKT